MKRFIPFRVYSILLFLAFPSWNQPATAQNQLSDSLVKERIQHIQKLLNEGKKGANTWWNGWLYGYTAATLVQGAIGITSNEKGIRQDMTLGAFTTFLGAAGQIVTPMTPGKAPDMLQKLPESSPEERYLKLEQAEELIKTSAKREKMGRSWKAQAVCGFVNAGSGLVTWLGFKRTVWAGLGNFALNTAITEAQIWTQPVRAIKDYMDYQNSFGGADNASINQRINWYVLVYPGRIGIRLVF